MSQNQTEGGYAKDDKARASVLRHLLPGLVSEVMNDAYEEEARKPRP